MNSSSPKSSPSAVAMERFIAKSPGLQQPQIAVKIPGLPTLPDLKKLAQERRAAGHEVIDQSAGDIDDVGQPLSDEFPAWIEQTRSRLVAEGAADFRPTTGGAFDYPGNYKQQYPVVTNMLAKSWGITDTPFKAVQTVSGRAVIDHAMRGLIARANAAKKGEGRKALIVDALAWSGYRPLAAGLDLTLVHMPALPEHGLSSSAEGLTAALQFAREKNLVPIGVIPILPSNPTGVGMDREELKRFVTKAAEVDLPVMIDAFYSPLVPEGHATAVPMAWLEKELSPEALGYLGVIVGETKVTSSQNKTGSLLWMAPEKNPAVAEQVIGAATARLAATNTYPRPQEALVAYALHTFPGGVHAAMGPRYEALDATRQAMRKACDDFGLPLSIGGSFYGTAALVDGEGESLIRDDAGKPITDPREVCQMMTSRFGLVGAPGGMFSPAPEAASMVRLTAAVTIAEVDKVRGIFEQMVAAAKRG